MREHGISLMLRWYLIYTKTFSESVAEANLRRQGYEVYFPRLARPIRQRGRWGRQVVALFPRYLFLRLDEGRQALSPVRSTVGVSTVVRFGSDYVVVPDRVILDLQTRADPESGLHCLGQSAVFTPGTTVSVTEGPFSGLDGVFQREAGEERVVVLLDLMGRGVPVGVPRDCVLPSHAA